MPTPEYGFNTPTVGGDDNAWGTQLNANWTALDAILLAMQDQIDDLIQDAEDRKIPVGGLYLATTSTNPATQLGYGTWEAYGAGRALVGVGDNGQATWTAGETRGNETHTLSEAEMPNHTHTIDPPNTNTSSAGNHNHNSNGGAFLRSGAGGPFGFDAGNSYIPIDVISNTSNAGAHTHSVNIPAFESGSRGAGNAHNNVQPSIAVYVWRRTN